MNPDVHTAPAEVQQPEAFTLPPEYEFMSVENIEQLRASQLEAELEIRKKTFTAPEPPEVAIKQLADSADEEAERYVSTHLNRDDNPELFDKLKALVATASYHRTGSTEWYLGSPDENGNHTRIETSGKSQYESELEKLFDAPADPEPSPDPNPADPDPPIPTAPTPEKLRNAETALDGARKRLAELSVQRRRMNRKGGKKAKALAEKFAKAQEAYETARVAYGKLQARQWLHEGADETTLRAKVIESLLDEHQNFTKAEAEHLTQDPSRRARIARFLAGHKLPFFTASAITGFGIGFGAGKVAKGALGLVGAATLPAAIAAGVAAKTTKAVLQSSVGNRVNQITRHDKRASEDYNHIKERAEQHIEAGQSADEMLVAAHGILASRIHERVHKDRRSNRNRVIASAAIGGAAGAAGFLLSDGMVSKNESGTISRETPSRLGVGDDHARGSTSEQPAGSQNRDENRIYREQLEQKDKSTPDKSAAEKPGVVDGYQTRVKVEAGHGYTHELADLAAQKDIKLTGEQSWELYQHLNEKFDGKFFTDVDSYKMSDGNWGISEPGSARWNPAVIHEMNRWVEEHNLSNDTKSAAKKVAKAAASRTSTV